MGPGVICSGVVPRGSTIHTGDIKPAHIMSGAFIHCIYRFTCAEIDHGCFVIMQIDDILHELVSAHVCPHPHCHKNVDKLKDEWSPSLRVDSHFKYFLKECLFDALQLLAHDCSSSAAIIQAFYSLNFEAFR